MLAHVEIAFINKQLNEMRLEDHLGHTTRIQFQHIKANTTLPSNFFTFKKPAKVDVIDETKNHR
jgi:outer membrane lipoprotein-sorting protein